MIPEYLEKLMLRRTIPIAWCRLKPEEKISIELANKLRELTLAGFFTAVWCHIPNEGKRSIIAGQILCAMGLISGTADFLFLHASGSAAIELKAGSGKLTTNQQYFREWCLGNGINHAVCYSADGAIEALTAWGIITTSPI